jgi:hypothetical protein
MAKISFVRRKLEYVAMFVLLCLWIDWRLLRNLGTGILAVLYLPIYLIENPWNGAVAALVMDIALAVLLFLVAGSVELLRRAKRRKHPSASGPG